ncbi:hypothetical protein PANDA_005707 [Ailuropoda melanoleuca]|uniref:Uncharacterized protein n=1 Tax=Ailuropoda melanoleuca TaxID=9646 RepID=D2H6S6_AILME|nr:hypothetical protein PANDA_005707 [Ailuropoda melanoleuca]
MIANKAIQETVVIVQVRRYEGLDIEEEGTDSQEERPSTEELLFRQEECTLPARKRVLEKNKWETWLQENWEDCTNLNLSFQDLGDPYQVANLNRILRRLIRVETLWLVDNSLVDLSAIRLPSFYLPHTKAIDASSSMLREQKENEP